MRAGNLRHRITILALSSMPDNTVSIVESLTPVVELWAMLEPVKGLVYFDTQQIGQGVTHRVEIRYYQEYNITSGNWLLYQNRYFRIRSVRKILEINDRVEMLCEEFKHD